MNFKKRKTRTRFDSCSSFTAATKKVTPSSYQKTNLFFTKKTNQELHNNLIQILATRLLQLDSTIVDVYGKNQVLDKVDVIPNNNIYKSMNSSNLQFSEQRASSFDMPQLQGPREKSNQIKNSLLFSELKSLKNVTANSSTLLFLQKLMYKSLGSSSYVAASKICVANRSKIYEKHQHSLFAEQNSVKQSLNGLINYLTFYYFSKQSDKLQTYLDAKHSLASITMDRFAPQIVSGNQLATQPNNNNFKLFSTENKNTNSISANGSATQQIVNKKTFLSYWLIPFMGFYTFLSSSTNTQANGFFLASNNIETMLLTYDLRSKSEPNIQGDKSNSTSYELYLEKTNTKFKKESKNNFDIVLDSISTSTNSEQSTLQPNLLFAEQKSSLLPLQKIWFSSSYETQKKDSIVTNYVFPTNSNTDYNKLTNIPNIAEQGFKHNLSELEKFALSYLASVHSANSTLNSNSALLQTQPVALVDTTNAPQLAISESLFNSFKIKKSFFLWYWNKLDTLSGTALNCKVPTQQVFDLYKTFKHFSQFSQNQANLQNNYGLKTTVGVLEPIHNNSNITNFKVINSNMYAKALTRFSTDNAEHVNKLLTSKAIKFVPNTSLTICVGHANRSSKQFSIKPSAMGVIPQLVQLKTSTHFSSSQTTNQKPFLQTSLFSYAKNGNMLKNKFILVSGSSICVSHTHSNISPFKQFSLNNFKESTPINDSKKASLFLDTLITNYNWSLAKTVSNLSTNVLTFDATQMDFQQKSLKPLNTNHILQLLNQKLDNTNSSENLLFATQIDGANNSPSNLKSGMQNRAFDHGLDSIYSFLFKNQFKQTQFATQIANVPKLSISVGHANRNNRGFLIKLNNPVITSVDVSNKNRFATQIVNTNQNTNNNLKTFTNNQKPLVSTKYTPVSSLQITEQAKKGNKNFNYLRDENNLDKNGSLAQTNFVYLNNYINYIKYKLNKFIYTKITNFTVFSNMSNNNINTTRSDAKVNNNLKNSTNSKLLNKLNSTHILHQYMPNTYLSLLRDKLTNNSKLLNNKFVKNRNAEQKPLTLNFTKEMPIILKHKKLFILKKDHKQSILLASQEKNTGQVLGYAENHYVLSKKEMQKKRKARKQRLESRRQKKRKRFYPRPNWLRLRLLFNSYAEHLKYRLKSKTVILRPLENTFSYAKNLTVLSNKSHNSLLTNCYANSVADTNNLNNYLQSLANLTSLKTFGSTYDLLRKSNKDTLLLTNVPNVNTLLKLKQRNPKLTTSTGFTNYLSNTNLELFNNRRKIGGANRLVGSWQQLQNEHQYNNTVLNLWLNAKKVKLLKQSNNLLTICSANRIVDPKATSSGNNRNNIYLNKIYSKPFYEKQLFTSRKTLIELKNMNGKQYANFEKQSTTNQPNKKTENNGLRDFWIWLYNLTNTNNWNQSLIVNTFLHQISLPVKMLNTKVPSYGNINTNAPEYSNVSYDLRSKSTISAPQIVSSSNRKTSLSANSKQTQNVETYGLYQNLLPFNIKPKDTYFSVGQNVKVLSWSLNKTNLWSSTNKRLNLWSSQKLRNQSKNNKTKSLEKQIQTKINSSFSNLYLKSLVSYNKLNNNYFKFQISQKLHQKEQKLGYLASIYGANRELGSTTKFASSKLAEFQNGYKVQRNSILNNAGFNNTFISKPVADIAWWRNKTAANLPHNTLINSDWQESLNKNMIAYLTNTIPSSNSNLPTKSAATSTFTVAAVLFHFCALISLISISQIRCFIKFHLILIHKLSNFYLQLIYKNLNLTTQTLSKIIELPNTNKYNFTKLLSSRFTPQILQFVGDTQIEKNKGPIIIPKNSAFSYKNRTPNIVEEGFKRNLKNNNLRFDFFQPNTIRSANSNILKKYQNMQWLLQKSALRLIKPLNLRFAEQANSKLEKQMYSTMSSKFTKKYKTLGSEKLKITQKSPMLDFPLRFIFERLSQQPTRFAWDTQIVSNQPKPSSNTSYAPFNDLRSKSSPHLSVNFANAKIDQIKALAGFIQQLLIFAKIKKYKIKEIASANVSNGNIKLSNLLFNSKELNIKALYYQLALTELTKKTTLTVKKTTLNTSYKIVDSFEYVLRIIYSFFEKPAELTMDWIAYAFLVEWSSDLLTFTPEKTEKQVWLSFTKLARQTKLSFFQGAEQQGLMLFRNLPANISSANLTMVPINLVLGQLLFKRILYLNDILLDILNKPDSDLLNRQKKGTLFWDIWSDSLIKAADKYNINVPSLSNIKEEQNVLIDKYLADNFVISKPNSNTTGNQNGQQNLFFQNPVGLLSKANNLNVLTVKTLQPILVNNKTDLNTISLTQQTMSIGYANAPHKQLLDYVISSGKITVFRNKNRFDSSILTNNQFENLLDQNVNKNTSDINQFVTYQSKETDLFLDYHPPKSFAHLSAIRYYNLVQQPLGTIVCQIYSGLLTKQIAKNVLVIGSTLSSNINTALERTQKTLLIQALAGETEIKIITDNASRYAMVNRGFAVGIKLLKDVFEAISLNTPCLFLLEDIHLIGERRPLLISDSGSDNASGDEMSKSADYTFGAQRNGEAVHEKNQILYQLNTHGIAHYKKPFKGDFSLSIPTNHFAFDLFLKQATRYSNSTLMPTHPFAYSLNSLEIDKITNPGQSNQSSELNLNNILQRLTSKRSITPTNFEITTTNEPLASSQQLAAKNFNKLLSPPSTSPFTVLLLKEQKKLKPKKIVKELPWVGLSSSEQQLGLAPAARVSYSVRAKVAALADLSFSNMSAKLDMITDLLVIIDSVRGNRGFVVFATTHLPHILDPALRRPGRLDETISIPTLSNIWTRWEFTKTNQPIFTFQTNNLFSTSCSANSTVAERLMFQLNLATPSNTKNILGYNGTLDYLDFINLDFVCYANQNTNLFSPMVAAKAQIIKSINLVDSNTLNRNLRFAPQIGFSTKKTMAANSNSLVNKQLQSNSLLVAQPIESEFWLKQKLRNSKKNLKQMNLISYHKIGKQLINHKYSFSLAILTPNYYNPTTLDSTLSLTETSPYLINQLQYNSLYSSTNLIKNTLLSLLSGKLSESFLASAKKQNYLASIKTQGFGKKSSLFAPPIVNGKQPKLNIRALKQNQQAISAQEVASNIVNLYGIDQTWKAATSLALSFIQKRYLYNKNLIVPKLLNFVDYGPLEEPPSPPLSNILIPAKRYENAKKTFKENIERKVAISIQEKLEAHTKQAYIKSIYTKNINLNSNTVNQNLQSLNLKTLSALDTYQNPLTQVSSVSFYYQNKILKRHRNYLNNQWWNGQLTEHSSEALFLSDIDWRYTFIDNLNIPSLFKNKQIFFNKVKKDSNLELPFNTALSLLNTPNSSQTQLQNKAASDKVNKYQDILIDFPDAEQYYNPKHRRWMLTYGSWSSWFNFDKNLQTEIFDHLIFECVVTSYNILDQNRELLDYSVSKYMNKGLMKELNISNAFRKFIQ